MGPQDTGLRKKIKTLHKIQDFIEDNLRKIQDFIEDKLRKIQDFVEDKLHKLQNFVKDKNFTNLRTSWKIGTFTHLGKD